jgi:FkbM family methyltransferase
MAKFFPNIKFYAVEPVKKSYENLIVNKYLNEIKNLECFNFALSNKKEEKNIKIPDHKGLCTLGDCPLFKEYEEEVVQCYRIDDIFINKEINMIKIDVEGWEFFVLLGGLQMINKLKPIILIEIAEGCLSQCKTTKQEIYNLIEKISYEIVYTTIDGGNIIIKHKN